MPNFDAIDLAVIIISAAALVIFFFVPPGSLKALLQRLLRGGRKETARRYDRSPDETILPDIRKPKRKK